MPQRTVWHRSGIAVPTERNVPAYSCVLAESRGPVENSSGRLAQLVLFLRLARSGGTGRRSRLKICRSFALCGFDSLLLITPCRIPQQNQGFMRFSWLFCAFWKGQL